MGYRLSEAEKAEIWDALERGESMRSISRRLGRANASIYEFVAGCAGRRPRSPSQSELRLVLSEREEISRGLMRQYRSAAHVAPHTLRDRRRDEER